MSEVILHDWSPISGCCIACGVMFEGSRPECVPTTAEPGCDEEGGDDE